MLAFSLNKTDSIKSENYYAMSHIEIAVKALRTEILLDPKGILCKCSVCITLPPPRTRWNYWTYLIKNSSIVLLEKLGSNESKIIENWKRKCWFIDVNWVSLPFIIVCKMGNTTLPHCTKWTGEKFAVEPLCNFEQGVSFMFLTWNFTRIVNASRTAGPFSVLVGSFQSMFGCLM